LTDTSATYFTYNTPHGPLTIAANERGITDIAFGEARFAGRHAASTVTNRTATEVLEYLAGKRRYFDVPLDLQGSSFQKAVWNELLMVPYAATTTASDIACNLGKPSAQRSVGTALKRNRIAILVPDHRVVGPSGVPVGSGHAAQIKRGLLALEKRVDRE
jgi:methylated-DNA-[protein]-cysteine S-methyltransferase